MALHEWHLQNYAMTVVDATMVTRRDHYLLDPPYQRGLVWTDAQREFLIRSLLEGIPCGIIYRNFRGFGAKIPYVIVDGKQRIDTIWRFYDGEMTVPAHWFDDKDLADHIRPNKGGEAWAEPGSWTRVSYLDLNDRGQRRFDMSNLAVYETRKLTYEMEVELYERVNYGGTPHEPKEA